MNENDLKKTDILSNEAQQPSQKDGLTAPIKTLEV